MKPEFLADLVDRFFDAAIAPFAARLVALEARPAPKDGEPGKSVTIDDVRPMVNEFLRGLPAPRDGTSVTLDDMRPLVADLVDERVKALPAPVVAKGLDAEDLGRFAAAFLRRLEEPLAQ